MFLICSVLRIIVVYFVYLIGTLTILYANVMTLFGNLSGLTDKINDALKCFKITNCSFRVPTLPLNNCSTVGEKNKIYI